MTELPDWDAVGRDAVATLSRYIQFDTTNPPGDELAAAGWLANLLRARIVMQDVAVHEPVAGRKLVPEATDGRYWCQRGFAPVIMGRSDLARVHGIDERISAENLLTGIKMARDITEMLCAA